MADAGLDDLLIAYNLLGAAKLERLVGAARTREPSPSRSTPSNCSTGSPLRPTGRVASSACSWTATRARPDGRRRRRRRGGARCGGRAPAIASLPRLPDAAHAAGRARRSSSRRSPRRRGEGSMRSASPPAGRRRCGRPSSLRPRVTEYRAGTYAFHDRATVAAGAGGQDDLALTVHATVVSRPTADRAVLDAGSKVLASEPAADGTFGLVLEAPALADRAPRRGARLRLASRTGRRSSSARAFASCRITPASCRTSSRSSSSSVAAGSSTAGPSMRAAAPAETTAQRLTLVACVLDPRSWGSRSGSRSPTRRSSRSRSRTCCASSTSRSSRSRGC